MRDRAFEIPGTPAADKRGPTAHARALAALKTAADCAASSPSGRLPSLRQMARKAAVSYQTAWKAARELQGEGALDVRHGSGLFAPRTAPLRAPGSRSERRGRLRGRLLGRIGSDIVQGVFPAGGFLPPGKQLQDRYGVSYSLLRGALDELRTAGRLEGCGRRLRVAGAGARPGHSMLVCIALWESSKTILRETPRTAEIYRALELESIQRGLHPVFYTFNLETRQLLTGGVQSADLGAVLDKHPATLGYIVLLAGLKLDERIIGMLRAVCGRRRRVCVVDEGNALAPSQFAGLRVRLFDVGGSPRSARLVARHLLDSGHRDIAYVSAHHFAAWSVGRLAGLREEFAAAGVRCRVRAIVDHSLSNYDDIYDRARSMARTVRVVPRIEVTSASRDLAATLQRATRTLRGEVAAVLAQELTRRACTPLFEKAVRQQATTAWVMADDATALQALGFLRRQGIAVPFRLSVVGFDDTPGAFSHGLTSFNFNLRGLAQSMIDHILFAQEDGVAARADRAEEAEGFLAVRSSTGAVRASRPAG